MKAVVNGNVIAESEDVVEIDGYQYFPSSAVRTEWLVQAPKTDFGSGLPTWCPILRCGDQRCAPRARCLVL